MVKILSITWNNNDTNDLIDVFVGPNFTLTNRFNAIDPPDRTDLLGIGPLSIFAVGLQDKSDELRVAGIKFSYEVDNPPVIPLPAAGWLLIAGVGGLAALKRKKRAA
jgi:hypothetical protein